MVRKANPVDMNDPYVIDRLAALRAAYESDNKAEFAYALGDFQADDPANAYEFFALENGEGEKWLEHFDIHWGDFFPEDYKDD